MGSAKKTEKVGRWFLGVDCFFVVCSHYFSYIHGKSEMMSDIDVLEKELEELKQEKKDVKHRADVEQEIRSLKTAKRERERKSSKAWKAITFLREWGENLDKMYGGKRK